MEMKRRRGRKRRRTERKKKEEEDGKEEEEGRHTHRNHHSQDGIWREFPQGGSASMERRVKRAKAHILMNKAGVQTSGVEYKDPAVRGVWGDEGNVGGNGRGHSAEYSASARGEDGGCGQAVRGCRQSEAVSAPEPGWGAAGAVLIPRPGFGDDHMLSHVAPGKAGSGRWVAWRRARKREEPPAPVHPLPASFSPSLPPLQLPLTQAGLCGR